MARTTPSTEALTAFLDRGCRFEGTLSFQGTVRIDGVYRGDIVAGNTLILGEQADVQGTITVDEVVVGGHFTGTIRAARRIVIKATGRVKADLAAPALGIDEGATFNGTVTMGAQAGRAEARGFEHLPAVESSTAH